MEDGNYDASRTFANVRDAGEYTVSVPEAADMFAAAGLPRTERAIQKYCKKGDLKFIPADTLNGNKYLISRQSLERLIVQKQQAQQFASQIDQTERSGTFANVPERSRPEERDENAQHHDATSKEFRDSDRSRDTNGDKSGDQGAASDGAKLLIKKLQDENLGLKIDVAGKQAFISQLVSERQQLMTAAQELSYKLGASETRVQQLEAPKRARVVHSEPSLAEETDPPGPVGEGGVPEPTAAVGVSEQSLPVLPKVEETKRSLFGRMFGT